MLYKCSLLVHVIIIFTAIIIIIMSDLNVTCLCFSIKKQHNSVEVILQEFAIILHDKWCKFHSVFLYD